MSLQKLPSPSPYVDDPFNLPDGKRDKFENIERRLRVRKQFIEREIERHQKELIEINKALQGFSQT